jgi:hypothetical protein
MSVETGIPSQLDRIPGDDRRGPVTTPQYSVRSLRHEPWVVFTGLVAPSYHPWFYSMYASILVHPLHCTAPEAHHEVLTRPTGKRIVTSYEVLAQEYFQKVDEQAGLGPGEGTRIEYVSGSVEAACALGLADGIGTLSRLTHMPYSHV